MGVLDLKVLVRLDFVGAGIPSSLVGLLDLSTPLGSEVKAFFVG